MGEIMPYWLSKQAELLPDGLAIEEKDRTWTFRELDVASKSFAKKLLRLGAKRGDKIAILAGNSSEFIIAVHAISYIGAIALLLNIRLTDQELAYQLNDADVTLVLTDEKMENETSTHQWRSKYKNYLFAEVEAIEEVEGQLQTEIDLDMGFTIMYTSGTTGHPKAVLHTYGNHWWSATGSMLNLGLHRQDKWLSVLPMFHIGGLSIFLKSVIYGMPVYLLRKFDVEQVHQAIMERGVTIASVVTVMVQQLLNRLGDRSYPVQFRCMLLGGGPAPLSLLEKAKTHHVPVFQSYGMTETSSQIVTLSPEDALRKLGSSGKPLFPAQLKIQEPDETGAGEILVKGPMVTKGYVGNETANAASFSEGWLKTGDLGKVDAEGYLYVLDRRKDLIISGGENVYPAEVESVLISLPGIQEAGVIGVEDTQWGQVPIAFVVFEKDKIEIAHIAAHCKEKLAAYKCPKQIYAVTSLPRNASNKLLRKELVHLIDHQGEHSN